MKVVYWNNQPTPYVVARFNAVAEHTDLEFEAWFERMREPDRSWDVDSRDWKFTWRLVGGDGGVPWSELEAARPDVFIGNYDKPNVVLGVLASRAFARRTALRVLPAFAAQMTQSPLRALAWHILFRAVDGAKVPGPDGRRFAAEFGLPSARTWPVTQSIDVDLYLRGAKLSVSERGSQRAAWGDAEVWFLYVGRFIQSKGIATLIDAWSLARQERRDIGLLMIGDGADAERFAQMTTGWPEVHWIGFIQPEDLPVIYGAADVLVFPTLGDPNGLVVEEAMAAGLPVVASDASGDIGMRVPTRAGRIFPSGDSAALAECIVALAGDDQARRQARLINVDAAQRYAPEFYARDFQAFVEALTRTSRRRSLASLIATVLATSIAKWRACRSAASEP